MEIDDALHLLTRDVRRTGVFTDFDGTLSEIVDDPKSAQPVEGAVDVLEALAKHVAIVAVVSGRSLDDLRSRVKASGVVLAGSYGRERPKGPPVAASEPWAAIAAAAGSITQELPGVVLEQKGRGIALHFRQAPEHAVAVMQRAGALAREFSLEIRPGRMVVELVEPGPGKGDAVAALASEADLTAVLVAGDDVGDVEAFRWARSSDLRSVVVAVASEEAPPELRADANVVLSGPVELVTLLRRFLELIE